jgi:hypothetical protein
MYKWFMAFLYPGFELIQKLFFLLYIHVLIFTHFDMFFRSIFIRFDMYLCLFSHPSICFYVYAHTLRYVSIFMLIHFDMFLYLCSYTSICFYIYAHTLHYVSILYSFTWICFNGIDILMASVLASGELDRVFEPRSVRPKTMKLVRVASSLSTQFKGDMSKTC